MGLVLISVPLVGAYLFVGIYSVLLKFESLNWALLRDTGLAASMIAIAKTTFDFGLTPTTIDGWAWFQFIALVNQLLSISKIHEERVHIRIFKTTAKYRTFAEDIIKITWQCQDMTCGQKIVAVATMDMGTREKFMFTLPDN